MDEWKLLKLPTAGQRPTALHQLPDVQAWSGPVSISSDSSETNITAPEPAWLAFAALPVPDVTPPSLLGPTGPRTSPPSQIALRPAALSRTASAPSGASDNGPEWSTEFSGEFLTAQAVLARRGRSRGRRSQAGSRATSRVAARSRVRAWAEVPTEEEVLEAMSLALSAQVLPPLAPLDAPAFTTLDSPRGRRAHPLTLEPSPRAAWDFERLFGSKPGGAGAIDLTHARWDDEQVPGPPASCDSDEVGWAAMEEERRRRAAERLEAVARHFEG